MTYSFRAESGPSKERCNEIVTLSRYNPFYTGEFIAARRTVGAEPWILSIRDDDRLVVACTAFMTFGRLNRKLEIQSLPQLPDARTFWVGLHQFCRDHKVNELVVNTFGSDEVRIPQVAAEIWRRPRVEFILNVSGEKLFGGISLNHKRNIKRATNAGVVIRQRAGFDGCSEHVRLVAASMYRRQWRGEQVAVRNEPELYRSFVDNGAGRLYQAVYNDVVLSSVLVLMAPRVGYYHSAGTTPEGMGLGASHFLISGIAERLRNEGLTRFNLGGASVDQHGLRRFKRGFGAVQVDLEAVAFTFGGPLSKAVRLAQRLLRLDLQI